MKKAAIATSLLAALVLTGATAAPAFAEPASTHFAVIGKNGKVLLGGKNVHVEKTDTGAYQLFFRDVFNVKNCAYTVTMGDNDFKGTPATGLAKVYPNPVQDRFMTIETMDKNGRNADRSFHVMAMCTEGAG